MDLTQHNDLRACFLKMGFRSLGVTEDVEGTGPRTRQEIWTNEIGDTITMEWIARDEPAAPKPRRLPGRSMIVGLRNLMGADRVQIHVDGTDYMVVAMYADQIKVHPMWPDRSRDGVMHAGKEIGTVCDPEAVSTEESLVEAIREVVRLYTMASDRTPVGVL